MSDDLIDDLLAGDHRALARVITKIENREPGYRDLVGALYDHTGKADVIGITGSPGAGKSTLVDKLAAQYREAGLTVGVIAIDPSSPYTGGAVLGDRIRMASNVGDMDVFFRSMSARGSLGGISTATADAVKALDAFGKDKIIIETVGAGQNEVDIVRTADLVTVVVPPGSGDDVQMLKAGILEIADVFVVNKADLEGAQATVNDLNEMVRGGAGTGGTAPSGHHHHGEDVQHDGADDRDDEESLPPIVETIATEGEGVEDLIETLSDRYAYLERTGQITEKARQRTADAIRHIVREDVHDHVEATIEARGGMETLVDDVEAGVSDPYTTAADLVQALDPPTTDPQ